MFSFTTDIINGIFGGTPTRVTMVHPLTGELQNAVTKDGVTAKFADGTTVVIPQDVILIGHNDPMDADPKKIKFFKD